jgi:predicted lactoylglutathione lyase
MQIIILVLFVIIGGTILSFAIAPRVTAVIMAVLIILIANATYESPEDRAIRLKNEHRECLQSLKTIQLEELTGLCEPY